LAGVHATKQQRFKAFGPTAISEGAGIGPRDVHNTIDSPFTAPFSSTQPNKHPKEENQEERPIATGAKTGAHYKFLFLKSTRRTLNIYIDMDDLKWISK